MACFCVQVCTRHVSLQLRWIPSIVKESRCHLMIGWTSLGLLCLGMYSLKYSLKLLCCSVRLMCIFVQFSSSLCLLYSAAVCTVWKHPETHGEKMSRNSIKQRPERSTGSYRTDLCINGFWQMASPGNWMHLQYQSKLQARKALSKDGKVFGETIMVGVKPCIDKVSVFVINC